MSVIDVEVDELTDDLVDLSDNNLGWFYAWNEDELSIVDFIDALAAKLEDAGIDIEMTGDDDWGAIRILKDGEPLK